MVTRLEIPERLFQQSIVDLARTLGWKVFHPWTSVHSSAGWPDLAMVKGERLIFAELKSARGRASPAQQEWLTALAAVPGVEVFTWRVGVDTLQDISELLRGCSRNG